MAGCTSCHSLNEACTLPRRLRADLLWDHTTPIPAIIEDTTWAYIGGPDGLPLEQIEQATGIRRYYHHDAIGSTRALTDDNGHVVTYSNYDSYGRPIGKPDTALHPFGYAGQYTDGARSDQVVSTNSGTVRGPCQLMTAAICGKSPASRRMSDLKVV